MQYLFPAYVISDKNPLSFKLFLPYIYAVIFCWLLSKFILCLTFSECDVLCCGFIYNVFVFILFGVCSIFWFCILIYISWQIWEIFHPSFFSLLLGLRWHECYIFFLVVSEVLLIYIFLSPFSFCYLYRVICILLYMNVYWLFSFIPSNWLLSSSTKFYHWFLYVLVLKFMFGSSLHPLFLHWEF